MRAVVLLVTAFVTALAPQPLFVFENAFWPNLHHFLYVLGRAAGGAPDAGRRAVVGAPKDMPSSPLTAAEREAWDAAVAFYRDDLSKKDAIFDESLFSTTREIAAAGSASALEGRALNSDLRAALERAAPVYRRAWWPGHRKANEARIAEVSALVERHGAAIHDQVTRAYGQQWPVNGRSIQICAYANWAGAYSTDSARGGLLVMSSLDPGTAGALGLEALFHEAMHQWDRAASAALAAAAQKRETRVPRNLTHAMNFYTAGDAVRRVIPGHVTYAEANGMWKGGDFATLTPMLDRAWRPWLDGTGTLESALEAMLQAPDRFNVRLETSRGDIVIAVNRPWAPRGADRFHELVRIGYFDDSRFFRVVAGQWAQFGINGDPKVSQAWRNRTFADDPRVESNTRGAVAFAWAVANGRTTQVFIGLRDNSAALDPQGFAPFGRVVTGMDVADALYSEYGEESGGGIRAGRQAPLFELGNAYLLERYPRLDYIRRAIIEEP